MGNIWRLFEIIWRCSHKIITIFWMALYNHIYVHNYVCSPKILNQIANNRNSRGLSHTHTIYKYIYICMCVCESPLLSTHIHTHIYIVIHRQTVSFYQNSSVWLDTQDARSPDRNPSNFTLDCVSDHSSTKRTTLAKGILRYFYF